MIRKLWLRWRIWQERRLIMGSLRKIGLLTDMDHAALEDYLRAYGAMFDARVKVK